MLVEALIGCVILSVALTALAAPLVMLQRSSNAGERRTQALRIVQRQFANWEVAMRQTEAAQQDWSEAELARQVRETVKQCGFTDEIAVDCRTAALKDWPGRLPAAALRGVTLTLSWAERTGQASQPQRSSVSATAYFYTDSLEFGGLRYVSLQ